MGRGVSKVERRWSWLRIGTGADEGLVVEARSDSRLWEKRRAMCIRRGSPAAIELVPCVVVELSRHKREAGRGRDWALARRQHAHSAISWTE